jgi:hypothetical protein
MATKKMDVPDIGNLLSEISKKRDSGELPKTEIQHVQPVQDQESNTSNVLKRQNVKTVKQENSETRGIGGRPSVKRDDIEYVKISPRIPKALKKQVEIAMIEERFSDKEGRSITTLDEIVALALTRLVVKP